MRFHREHFNLAKNSFFPSGDRKLKTSAIYSRDIHEIREIIIGISVSLNAILLWQIVNFQHSWWSVSERCSSEGGNSVVGVHVVRIKISIRWVSWDRQCYEYEIYPTDNGIEVNPEKSEKWNWIKSLRRRNRNRVVSERQDIDDG